MNFLKKNKGTILRIIIFLIGIFIIVYTLPSERKFRYEIQKSKPWQHENMTAPFDFAIYKLPEEFNNEKDSIKKLFKPYFDFNKEVQTKEIIILKQNYEQHWNLYIKMDSMMRKSDSEYKKLKRQPDKIIFNEYFNEIIENINFVYQSGIIDPTNIIEEVQNPNLLIIINKNNEPKVHSYNFIFTEKTAYEFVISELEKKKDRNIINFFSGMNIASVFKYNLLYNNELTEKLKKEEINEISQTRGFVKAGEKIIQNKEIVDADKYRILLSLKKEYEKSVGLSANHYLIVGGHISLIVIMLVIVLLFIYNYKPEILQNTPQVILLLLLIVMFIVIASITIRYDILNIYIIPFALLPIIVKVFFDERIALFVHIVTVFIIGFILPNSFEFILLQFTSGFAAIFALSTLSRRGQIYMSSAGAILSLSLLYFAIALIQEGDFTKIKWVYFAYFGANSLLLLLAYPLIFAFEKIFGFISDVTLLEISNTNNPLLQKLVTKAPGTFQHSIQVANLAEAAASKISANSLLIRAGALYHDIGKTASPIFFIENQVSGINPHDSIEFDKSAEIIINHVKKGVELARKHKLPEQVIDFIRTHHGDTKVQYFYKSYIKKYPESNIDISKFTYPGPRPFSKETAILMMADSIEAASRSIKEINKDKINALVENIIDYQIKENQFIDTDITFKEITTIKELFKGMLINIYHARIEYPK